jgi:hypothetical protein
MRNHGYGRGRASGGARTAGPDLSAVVRDELRKLLFPDGVPPGPKDVIGATAPRRPASKADPKRSTGRMCRLSEFDECQTLVYPGNRGWTAYCCDAHKQRWHHLKRGVVDKLLKSKTTRKDVLAEYPNLSPKELDGWLKPYGRSTSRGRGEDVKQRRTPP